MTPGELLDLHAGVRILSLDFFDTLITRSVAQPTHVFAVMEEKLVSSHGPKWDGFALRRVMAERSSRESVALEDEHADVTLAQVHEVLGRDLGLSGAESDMVVALEQSTECELAVAVGFGKELLESARARGLRVAVVSDNYMPASHLVAMAAAAGVSLAPEEIWVSCEHGAMKHDGSLWPVVLRSWGVEPGDVLHVGDLDDADGTIPASFGILTHVRHVMRRSHREPLNTCPAVLPLSRAEAASRDAAAHGGWDATANLASGALAIVVAGQVLDMVRRAAVVPVAGIHYMSRDGHLAHTVHELARERGLDLPPSTYVGISRSVLWRASVRDVTETSLQRFVGDDEVLTPARLGRRLGCTLSSEYPEDARLEAAQSRELLMQNAGVIAGACDGLREGLMRHLHAKGVTAPGHHLVMDLGWTGSVVAELASLLHVECGGTVTVEGRLTGMYWDATPNRAHVLLNGLAFDDFGPKDDGVRLLGMLRYFESLLGEDAGSVVGYLDGNAVRGDDSGVPMIDVRHGSWQKMAGRIVREATDILMGWHPSVAPGDITPEVVRATMLQVGHTPTRPEIEALATARHETAVDHAGDGNTLACASARVPVGADPDSLAGGYDHLVRHHWVQGTLASWEGREVDGWVADEIRRLWPALRPAWVEVRS